MVMNIYRLVNITLYIKFCCWLYEQYGTVVFSCVDWSWREHVVACITLTIDIFPGSLKLNPCAYSWLLTNSLFYRKIYKYYVTIHFFWQIANFPKCQEFQTHAEISNCIVINYRFKRELFQSLKFILVQQQRARNLKSISDITKKNIMRVQFLNDHHEICGTASSKISSNKVFEVISTWFKHSQNCCHIVLLGINCKCISLLIW